MMRDEIVIKSIFGPNRVIVSHNPSNQRIDCECEYMLLVEDMRYIEENILNLHMYLGARHGYSYYESSGKIYIGWGYTEGPDLDWS